MSSGRNRKYRYFACDFETTVYDNIEETEVWASACVEIGTENVSIFHSIADTYNYFTSLKSNLICYYHNLKFDGNFWLYYLLNVRHMKQATVANTEQVEFLPVQDMPSGSFTYLISDMGQWYSITIKHGKYIIVLRDSLKLLPFSLKVIGKSFKTKHQKLEMEYKGFRYAGCEIKPEEVEYIKNDVLVLKEALEIMFNAGHKKITIGSCCLSEYKAIVSKQLYEAYFPDITGFYLDKNIYGYDNADSYIRKSYHGGWCYLVPSKANKVFKDGTTADVNSLYPSMMSSESGNEYPVGQPHFWSGNEIPEAALQAHTYYFVRIRTRFYLKPGKLPFIQIKGSHFYKGTDMLETSDLINKSTGERSAYYIDLDGNMHSTAVTMTMTMTDYILFREHYNVIDFEILDGCYFNSEIGIFDDYINKYKKIKLESTGAMRTLAKLFLNNLYGKMASNTESSFKFAFMREDESVGFREVEAYDKKAGYIPVGSAITSYARNFTIRAAQKNYHGDKPGFIYADTDSIHCDLQPDEFIDIPVDDKDFCKWKLEASWDTAKFVRQKTYMEHVVKEDLKPIDNPYWNIKCAGLPDRCKQLFQRSMDGDTGKEGESNEIKEFLSTKRSIDDFTFGLKIPGKLLPKRIKGGVVLTDTYFEMRE